MQSQLHLPRMQGASVWSTTPVTRLEGMTEPPWDATRDRWLAAFTERLAELRPDVDTSALRAVAADLWIDLGGHDPVIAAEMEHEADLG